MMAVGIGLAFRAGDFDSAHFYGTFMLEVMAFFVFGLGGVFVCHGLNGVFDAKPG